jgi:hypothetical protein
MSISEPLRHSGKGLFGLFQDQRPVKGSGKSAAHRVDVAIRRIHESAFMEVAFWFKE